MDWLRTHFGAVSKFWHGKKYEISRDFVSGGIAGAVSRTAVAPLERLKIMYMVGGPHYKGMPVKEALIRIGKEEGLVGFFRGNGANVARIVPFTAIQLSVYPIFKSIATENDTRKLTKPARFVCGVMAGILASVATYPLDFIRCRLSMQNKQNLIYNGVIDGIVKVVKQEGFFTLYSGLAPTILGISAYAGIQLSVYDLTKDIMTKLHKDGQNTEFDFFVAGAWAGLVAQTAAFPIELIRRRMQVRGFEIGGVDSSAAKSKVGFVSEFFNVYRAEGIRGLYRGLVPNYLKIIPAVGINFLVFEEMKALINKYVPDKTKSEASMTPTKA